MRAQPYQSCQECGRSLDDTTMYRRHAYCPDCDGTEA
jgi:predicted RNA-binding Zn-ribbon protein involved in translation (DUF1610 family)